jgi:hypothetical protein
MYEIDKSLPVRLLKKQTNMQPANGSFTVPVKYNFVFISYFGLF